MMNLIQEIAIRNYSSYDNTMMFQKAINCILSKLQNFWEGKIMDFISSPSVSALAPIVAFYEYFGTLSSTSKIFSLVAFAWPFLSLIRLKYLLHATRDKKKLVIKKEELATKLIEIRDKLKPYPTGKMINHTDVKYKEIVTVLKESGIISPAVIHFFQEGRLPPRPLENLAIPGKAREILLNDLIDYAMERTL